MVGYCRYTRLHSRLTAVPQDMGRESPAISEVPVTVHVEMVIEKDKVLV